MSEMGYNSETCSDLFHSTQDLSDFILFSISDPRQITFTMIISSNSSKGSM